MTSPDIALEQPVPHREWPRLVRGPYRWLRARRYWMLIVALPTLLIAGYLYGFAADQYETEAHFVVRSADRPQQGQSGLGQALTLVGGPSEPSQRDAMIVGDYLTSHDAVAALRARLDLVGMFSRPEADVFSRMRSSDPAPETLARFYDGKVDVNIGTETGITVLKVRAFRPEDAMAIIRQLLKLSEERVNALNQRNYASALTMARRQVGDAEREVDAIQARITAFRRGTRDFNPQTTGQARTTMVSGLQARLAQARAQEASMAAVLAPSSPQMVAIRGQVAALAREAAAEQGRIAAGPGNVATGLGTFEELQLRQSLAAKQFEGAVASLQRAQEDASRQQLFIVPVVDPNLPVKSLYPKRLRITATVFFALLLAYAIGWLIAAGVKEHAS